MTTIKKLSLAGAFVLGSAGLAAAAPAIVESDLNLRAGPSTSYGVIDVMPGGASVDVLNCTGSWCRVGFGGTVGYASRSYLDIGGGVAYSAPAPVYAAPVYDYGYDYWDEPYYYGPSFGVGISFGDGWRGRHWRGHHWRDRDHDWRGSGSRWSGGHWNGGGRGTPHMASMGGGGRMDGGRVGGGGHVSAAMGGGGHIGGGGHMDGGGHAGGGRGGHR